MHTPTVLAPTAAGWTLLHVASKVQPALTDRLGVAGGPVVPAEHHAAFGPGEVAAAQRGGPAVGLAGALLLLAPLLPVARRANRWVLSVPLTAVGLVAVAGAVGMLGRAALTDSGGAGFGLHCTVWTLLVGATTLAHHRPRRPARHPATSTPPLS